MVGYRAGRSIGDGELVSTHAQHGAGLEWAVEGDAQAPGGPAEAEGGDFEPLSVIVEGVIAEGARGLDRVVAEVRMAAALTHLAGPQGGGPDRAGDGCG